MNSLGRWWIETWAALWRRVPESIVSNLGWALGLCWYYGLPIRRGHVKAMIGTRLNPAPGGVPAIARRVYVHLATSIVELLRFGTRSGKPLSIDYRGGHHLNSALSAGRGVLVLTAHLGNWEALVRYGRTMPAPVSIVSREMKSAFWQGAWDKLREGGPNIISAQGSARSLVHRLRDHEIVGFVLDQHAPGSDGCPTRFLGYHASTSIGLARLASLTGATVVPMFTWREGSAHVVEVGQPMMVARGRRTQQELVAMTQGFVDIVEQAVLAHPEQWLWLHRRWKGRLTEVVEDGVGESTCGARGQPRDAGLGIR